MKRQCKQMKALRQKERESFFLPFLKKRQTLTCITPLKLDSALAPALFQLIHSPQSPLNNTLKASVTRAS